MLVLLTVFEKKRLSLISIRLSAGVNLLHDYDYDLAMAWGHCVVS